MRCLLLCNWCCVRRVEWWVCRSAPRARSLPSGGQPCQVGKPATPLSVVTSGIWKDAMSSKKLDAAIDALVDALAELPEHELEGGSAATG